MIVAATAWYTARRRCEVDTNAKKTGKTKAEKKGHTHEIRTANATSLTPVILVMAGAVAWIDATGIGTTEGGAGVRGETTSQGTGTKINGIGSMNGTGTRGGAMAIEEIEAMVGMVIGVKTDTEVVTITDGDRPSRLRFYHSIS